MNLGGKKQQRQEEGTTHKRDESIEIIEENKACRGRNEKERWREQQKANGSKKKKNIR